MVPDLVIVLVRRERVEVKTRLMVGDVSAAPPPDRLNTPLAWRCFSAQPCMTAGRQSKLARLRL